MPGLKWEVVKLGCRSSRMLVDEWLRQENQAALPQDLFPLGTIPAPSLAPLSPGNASIPYGLGLVRLTVRVRARKSCEHRPLIPWQEGTWLGSRAHVSMARPPGTGFPTVTQGHDCTGALTSRKSSDKVKIELCSLGASGPAEVLSLCSPADSRDMRAGAFPAPRARPSHKGCSAAGLRHHLSGGEKHQRDRLSSDYST